MPHKYSFDASEENHKFLRERKSDGKKIGAVVNGAIDNLRSEHAAGRQLAAGFIRWNKKKNKTPKRKEHK